MRSRTHFHRPTYTPRRIGEVWTIARQDLTQRFLQVHTVELPLLRKTKELHRDAAEIIALREDLRLHVTAVRRFGVILGAQGPVMVKLGLLYGNKMGLGHDVIQEELGTATKVPERKTFA